MCLTIQPAAGLADSSSAVSSSAVSSSAVSSSAVSSSAVFSSAVSSSAVSPSAVPCPVGFVVQGFGPETVFGNFTFLPVSEVLR